MTPQEMLDQWKAERGVGGEILWGGYEELGGSSAKGFVMGQCRMTKYRKQGSDEWTPRSTIYADVGMRNAPSYFQTCNLWHEFCHAWAYNEDGEDDAHNSHWREYRRTILKYWFGDLLLKVLGRIWCK